MSVDLIGSTAFKANKNHSDPKNGSPSPAWVDEFRTFYKDFPIEVAQAYEQIVKNSGDELLSELNNRPRVWKTIGDEITFCGRVRNIEHAAASVTAFLKALERYSKRLEKDDKPLGLKGAGWLAAFPAPNISIAITSDPLPSTITPTTPDIVQSENTEDFEKAADDNPNRFDFLGKGIDTGFRISKNASEDRFITSVQLGYVLAKAATKKKFPHSFGYHGREVLKGVIDGAPYPVVSVDTERSETNLKLKSREAALTGAAMIQPHSLFDFLETFMNMDNIDVPCLGEGHESSWTEKWPESYIRYQTAFEQQLNIDNENVRQVNEGGDLSESNDDSLNKAKSFLDEFESIIETVEDEGNSEG